jgi:hypothetical protein
MKYIEAPEVYSGDKQNTLFLAGGITGCPNWQYSLTFSLETTNLSILNPRRKHFPIDDPTAASEQIKWEFDHLRKAEFISFWFPKESICPIALYELGAWSMTDKILFVGCHPEYQRRLDIEEQTSLVRPDINIVYSLNELANQIMNYQEK